jgi:hypothetical protein
MIYVCQIHNNLLGQMDECSTWDEATALVRRIVKEEHGVELTDEVKEEIENAGSYRCDQEDWAVCIGQITE